MRPKKIQHTTILSVAKARANVYKIIREPNRQFKFKRKKTSKRNSSNVYAVEDEWMIEPHWKAIIVLREFVSNENIYAKEEKEYRTLLSVFLHDLTERQECVEKILNWSYFKMFCQVLNWVASLL